jgi:hypothetical protein
MSPPCGRGRLDGDPALLTLAQAPHGAILTIEGSHRTYARRRRRVGTACRLGRQMHRRIRQHRRNSAPRRLGPEVGPRVAITGQTGAIAPANDSPVIVEAGSDTLIDCGASGLR